ncbi:MAG: adenylosuccinate lyase [Candidatus Thorarchaeota archaeon]
MPVNPIDYGRYGHLEMVTLFEEEFRHSLWLRVESTVAKVQADLEMIPKEAAQDIQDTATPSKVTLARTMEIENRTRHDVAALFEAIAEKCEGVGSRWVHFGLTSNDVKDTALGMQLKAAYDVLIPQVDLLCKALAARAQETKDLLAIGRSHGQHAVPITYGLRFSVWLDEILRHRARLITARQNVSIGKIAGATGSHAALGPIGLKLQQQVMEHLGLDTPIATTQIIQRDRHAEAILGLANLVASLDKFATDLRALQRTEIGETFEPFARGKQVGSSAMPHKRNPVTCEKISGLARFVRSLAAPALENVISWEERDISHSSTERFILPQAFILSDYLIREMTRVIEGLEIDREAVNRNLEGSNESTLSEYILTQLTKAGMERPKAHEILRNLNIRARDQNVTLFSIIQTDEETAKVFAKAEVDVEKYYESIRETSRSIVEAAVRKYNEAVDTTE